eukprot:scaffold4856_cov29-Tisochrysis_lutea.AAC.9
MANSEASKFLLKAKWYKLLWIMDECDEDDYESAGTLVSLLNKDLIQKFERVQAELKQIKEKKPSAAGEKKAKASVDAPWETIYLELLINDRYHVCILDRSDRDSHLPPSIAPRNSLRIIQLKRTLNSIARWSKSKRHWP